MELSRQADVFFDGLPGEEPIILEDDGQIRPGTGHFLAGKADLSFCRRLQAGDEPQEGRFPAARWPDDGQVLAFVQAEADMLQDALGAVAA